MILRDAHVIYHFQAETGQRFKKKIENLSLQVIDPSVNALKRIISNIFSANPKKVDSYSLIEFCLVFYSCSNNCVIKF